MPAKPAPTDAQLLPWHDLAVVPALVPGACLSRALLAQFAQRMRQQGLPIQPQRMRYDRIYAQQCLTTAHCVGDSELRALSVALFDVYHGLPLD